MNGDPRDTTPRNRVDIFLDDAAPPVLSTRAPFSFEMDTSKMDDGPHVMRIEAYDESGVKGIRTVHFTVRNGPGIAISGLHEQDVVEGKIPVIVNAYGGTSAVDWEPSQAETPAPPPTWAWVSLILAVAFGLFYGIQQWSPPDNFARTPTYGMLAASSGMSPADAASAAALPTTAASGASLPTMAASGAALPTAAASGASLSTMAETSTGADTARGSALFSANCAACHQPTGQGLAGVFPPLAGDPVVKDPDPARHITTILDGRQGSTIGGVTYASPMPAFKDILNDADIAAIVNYERTSWGNAAPLVGAADVARLRQ